MDVEIVFSPIKFYSSWAELFRNVGFRFCGVAFLCQKREQPALSGCSWSMKTTREKQPQKMLFLKSVSNTRILIGSVVCKGCSLKCLYFHLALFIVESLKSCFSFCGWISLFCCWFNSTTRSITERSGGKDLVPSAISHCCFGWLPCLHWYVHRRISIWKHAGISPFEGESCACCLTVLMWFGLSFKVILYSIKVYIYKNICLYS